MILTARMLHARIGSTGANTSWPPTSPFTAFRPARSTPARTPTRPPARPSCRSMPRRRSPRKHRAGTRDTSTLGAAIRPGPRSKLAWRRSRGASGRSPLLRAWPRPPPCFRPCGPVTRWPPRPISTAARFACWNASSSRGELVPRYTEDASPEGFAAILEPGHQAGLDRDADQPAAPDPRYRRDRRGGSQPRRLAGGG